jgi:putative oxidoreductase
LRRIFDRVIARWFGYPWSWVNPLRTGIASSGWGMVPLRLLIGFGFASHGYAKLARGPAAFAAILSAIGIPAANLTAWVTSLTELFGGIAIVLGAAVAPAALPLIAIMLTAIFGVHLRYGFSSVNLESVSAAGAVFGPVGYELSLLYIVGLIALALSGPSAASVDRWRQRRRTARETSLPCRDQAPPSGGGHHD